MEWKTKIDEVPNSTKFKIICENIFIITALVPFYVIIARSPIS